MYDIRQFKPALYFLLFVGITGFALAAQWPGVWVLAVGGLALNAWLVKTGRFTPMPRILASIVTIIAFVYIADLVLHSTTTPILIIGQFLVLLQLVKLYEQRANRDFAQLIILSLLLMVAAAINTASLLFGLIFIGYLFLSLYVCLLFHLKVESEQARKAIALPEVEPNPNTLRQDQRYLSSSMRRLTGLISVCAVIMAVVVFLFFPRHTGSNILGPLQFKPSRALTGFSEQVGFQQVARITQNNELVAHVKVWHGDRLVQGTQPLLLRGLALDFYSGAGTEFRFSRSPYQWSRLIPQGNEINESDERLREIPAGAKVWRQEVTLRPTGTSVIFAMEGPAKVRMARRNGYRHSRYDDALQLTDVSMQPIDYEVISTGEMRYEPYPRERTGYGRWRGSGQSTPPPAVEPATLPSYMPTSNIDPQIDAYARNPDVSGRGPDGVPLVTLRQRFLDAQPPSELLAMGNGWRRNLPLTPYDEQIAQNIERHLQTTFTYTLDLTDAKRIEGQDPMVAFLYDLKRGHCEYFAGAMTLMLQSLEIPARMVIGFRCDEYNAVGGYYRVEQSHAHAWVEMRGGSVDDPLWVTFDPTSGREDSGVRAPTLWMRAKHVFDFLEHTWAANVIAYDRGSRESLVQALENQLTSTAVNSSQTIAQWPKWLRAENWAISSQLIFLLIVLAVLAMIVAVGWFVWERWRLWRRAERIGLDTLPSDQRLRLVRQLAFYDDLLRLLERRGLTRPRHLTPMEFTDSLAFLPAEAYHAIRRLTEVFYRIRYGRQDLSSGQRQRLNGVIARVETILGPAQA